jgi:exosortase
MDLSAESLRTRIKADWVNFVLAALGFAPLLWLFLAALWSHPTYQFFPLALVAAGMLAWRAVREMDQPVAAGGLWPARLLVLAAGVVYLTANILWSPWLCFIAFILVFMAVVHGLGGWPLMRALAPAGLMLLAILPPPFNWDQTLTFWLRSVAVGNSNALLDWLHVNHVQDGNTLLLPGKSLLVEEACSGINSFVLCNAACLFWVLWQRRPFAWLLLAMPATSLFVVLGNIIRITVGATGFYYWKLNLLSGWQHETFGLVLLLIYCGLIMSLDQFLVFLTKPIDAPAAAPAEQIAPPVHPRLDAPGSGPAFGFKLGGAFLAVVGLGVFAAHIYSSRGQTLHSYMDSFTHLNRQELKLSLPTSLAGWQRINSDAGDKALVQTFGVHSLTWYFQRDGIEAVVAVDYPLDGFHNVKICYLGNGWQIAAEDEMFVPQSHEDLHAIKLTLEKSIHHAVVYHSVVDGRGNWLSAPAASAPLKGRFANSSAAPIQTGYRVQLIVGGYSPLSSAAAAATQDLFFQARQTLVQQIAGQLGRNTAK